MHEIDTGFMDDSEILGAVGCVCEDIDRRVPEASTGNGARICNYLEHSDWLHCLLGRHGVACQYLSVYSSSVLL